MSDVTFVIQARLGSTRLPNKIVLPFSEGKSIFEITLEKLKVNFPEYDIVLSTSSHPQNDLLVEIANHFSFNSYRGSENDVLKRFIETAKTFDSRKIIRICADNPFLDMKELRVLLDYVSNNCEDDYVSFKVNDVPSIRTHFGFWTEYVTLEALHRTSLITQEQYYHEHVTNYIYENPEIFKIKFLPVTPILEGRNDIRMTLDTLTDFQLLSEIYKELSQKYEKKFGIEEIVAFLNSNSEYNSIMKEQINLNSK